MAGLSFGSPHNSSLRRQLPGNIRAGRMNLRLRTAADHSFSQMPEWHNVVVAAPVPARRPRRLVGYSGFGVALGFAVITVVVIWFTAPWATTYSGSWLPAAMADLAAGLGLMLAGLLLLLEWPGRALGLMAALAGAVWLAPDWVGWQDGPPLARTIAMVAAPLFLPLVLHLLLAFPGGSPRSALARLAVRGVYAATGIVSVTWALFRDPRLDPHCWNNCTDNSFLVSAQPAIERGLETAGILLALGLGTAIVAVCAGRLARGTKTARRRLAPVLLPGLLVGGSAAAQAIALLRTPLEGPQFASFSALFQARAWSVCALAAGLAWTVVRARLTRLAVGRVASDLGDAPAPGALGAVLAKVMNDPGVEVAYWLPESGRFVDGSGQTVREAVPGHGKAVTWIVRKGQPVAIVRHDAAATDADRLERAIGAAARLAVDNERLQAGVLAQLEALRASRARIVEAGDAERRRLERNLHDGAQQRLLALSYELRLARGAAATAGVPELEVILTSAVEQAQEAASQLRDLAHGIYPAILTEAGLGLALESLAESAPLPVVVRGTPDRRFPEPVERAAYLVAAGSIDAGLDAGTGKISIRVALTRDHLVVEAEGAGTGPFTDLADRVGAIGGRLAADRLGLRAEIPCA
jgi:signal transduction histidine kinase